MSENNRCKVVMSGIGHHHAEGVMDELRKNGNFEVVGLVEDNDDTYQQNKDKNAFKNIKRLDYSQVIADSSIDGIIIETEMEKLVEEASRYMEKKCPLHIDKPAGLNYEDFESFIKKVKKDDIKIQMGYMYRYNPAVQESMKLKEEMGDIYEVDAVMNTEQDINFRKWLAEYPAGTMFVFGCHMIDLILMMQGEPKQLYSFNKQSGFDGVKVDDVDLAVLEYANGTSTARVTSVEVNGYGRRQLVVCGEKATIEIRPLENTVKMTYAKKSKDRNPYKDEKEEIDLTKYNLSKGRYTDMMDDFAKIIRGESDLIYPVDLDYELTLQKTILKACECK